MKRLLIVLSALLVLVAAFPAAAQDATCVPDLGPVAAQIMAAQALASSGDRVGSVAALREARATLAAIQSACADAGVTPILLLEGEFSAADSPYLFNYPGEWVLGDAQRPAADLIVQPLGNTTRAASQALQANPVFAPGDQGGFVAIGSLNAFGLAEGGTPVDVLNGIAAGLPDGYTAQPVAETTINDLPAATLRYSGPTAEGYLIVRVVSPELGVIAQVAGVAPTGELDPLIPVVEAIARSVR